MLREGSRKGVVRLFVFVGDAVQLWVFTWSHDSQSHSQLDERKDAVLR